MGDIRAGCSLVVTMVRVYQFDSIAGYFCTPQKASVGMYSRCDYLLVDGTYHYNIMLKSETCNKLQRSYILFSLVPRPLPRFLRATLKTWERPGYEAKFYLCPFLFRQLPQEDDTSPFCRNGVFSRIITTVSPHNPFNKIEF